MNTVAGDPVPGGVSGAEFPVGAVGIDGASGKVEAFGARGDAAFDGAGRVGDWPCISFKEDDRRGLLTTGTALDELAKGWLAIGRGPTSTTVRAGGSVRTARPADAAFDAPGPERSNCSASTAR